MRKILRKKNIKFYLIYYLIIELFTKFSTVEFFVNFTYKFWEAAINTPSIDAFIKLIIIGILVLVLYVVTFSMMTLPVTLFLLARKTVDIEQEMKSKKYTSREKIIYYRDKLNGISPATISLMQNLKIEEEKDLIATLLKLQLMGNIVINGDTISIVSEDMSKLLPSEVILFEQLKTGKLRRSYIEDWKRHAVVEAKAQGYVKDKKSSRGLKLKKAIIIFLFALSLYCFLTYSNTVLNSIDEVLNLDIQEDMSFFDIPTHEDSKIIMDTLLQATLLLICMLGIFGCPILYFIFHVMYKFQKDELKRTYKGEALTDAILGMKRFLHDFSMLNEADKEVLGLWDEFLIYAVVLGENEKVINEILDVKKISISNIKTFLND